MKKKETERGKEKGGGGAIFFLYLLSRNVAHIRKWKKPSLVVT